MLATIMGATLLTFFSTTLPNIVCCCLHRCLSLLPNNNVLLDPFIRPNLMYCLVTDIIILIQLFVELCTILL